MMKKYIVFSFCLVSFFFRAEEISIEELVSVGSKINQSEDLISSTIDIIDSEDLERQSEKDVLSVLSNTLAIDTSRYGGFGQISSVFLRGTNSNHTIFQVNGVKINPSTAGGASIYILQELLNTQKIYNKLDSEPNLLTAKEHRPPYGSDGDYSSKPSFEDIFEKVYEIMNEVDPNKYSNI